MGKRVSKQKEGAEKREEKHQKGSVKSYQTTGTLANLSRLVLLAPAMWDVLYVRMFCMLLICVEFLSVCARLELSLDSTADAP